jgi:hypothetical protein
MSPNIVEMADHRNILHRVHCDFEDFCAVESDVSPRRASLSRGSSYESDEVFIVALAAGSR